MNLKRAGILILSLSMGLVMSFASFAEEEVKPQYDLETFGSATAISPDDYLLDGNFENGELVNGGIYFNEDDAIAGVEQDKLDDLNDSSAWVYPGTGVVEGINSSGNFFYTIKSSGKTSYGYSTSKSNIYVTTQSDIYNSSDDTILTSNDYSYIVTLLDSGSNSVGSFRGYMNNVNGGTTFTSTSSGPYKIKIAVESIPSNCFLHGAGSIVGK